MVSDTILRTRRMDDNSDPPNMKNSGKERSDNQVESENQEESDLQQIPKIKEPIYKNKRKSRNL